MTHRFLPKPAWFLAALACMGCASCASNAELQKRLDRRNDSYSNLQDRREMRQDARDDRYNAWYDRVMD